MSLELPEKVRLFEVSPRDGFQNEREIIPTSVKIDFIDRLSLAGFSDIEVGSFVSPKWIPQLADTREVLEGITRRPGTRYWALVPNRRGFRDALEAGVAHIAVFMSCSEMHNQKNVNRPIAWSLAELGGVIRDARAEGMEVRAYLSTVFGCPYEGWTEPARVEQLGRLLIDAGASQLSLGDTIGIAHPQQVTETVEYLSRTIPLERLALHMHDTRGLALANVLAGLMAGIRTFDASMGSIGGCPYAPGAAGNLGTEELLYLLSSMDIETGVELADAADCGVFLRDALGHDLPGRYHAYHLAWSRRRDSC